MIAEICIVRYGNYALGNECFKAEVSRIIGLLAFFISRFGDAV